MYDVLNITYSVTILDILHMIYHRICINNTNTDVGKNVLVVTWHCLALQYIKLHFINVHAPDIGCSQTQSVFFFCHFETSCPAAGWGMQAFMQWATAYGIPAALAVKMDWSSMVSTVKSGNHLFYWFEPLDRNGVWIWKPLSWIFFPSKVGNPCLNAVLPAHEVIHQALINNQKQPIAIGLLLIYISKSWHIPVAPPI